jgi:hypothetical protein
MFTGNSTPGPRFEDLTLDGNRANRSGGATIISAQDETEAVNVRFIDAYDNAFDNAGGSDHLVRQCHFEGSGRHDISGAGSATGDRYEDNVHRNAGQRVSGHAVFLRGDDVQVRDIDVIGTSANGISVDESAVDWVIDGGRIENADFNGIETEAACVNGDIKSVNAYRCGQTGILVKNDEIDVTGCKCILNGLAGFRFGDSDPISNLLVSGCKARDNGQATGDAGFDFIGTGGTAVLSGIVSADEQTTATQTYGVEENGNWTTILVDGAMLDGNANGAINGAAITTGDTA